ncbi:MAG: SDR family NAD(P)-dependent oxidoreductase, partial [Thermodesulfobacteriota bacterium]|nr:SDR family NAD(P)-dependent oxidoreductase [Thermodesulfobacteriota bacterium]
MELNGIVAVITGGVSGLGEACARILVENGGKASLLDLNQERGAALTAELGKASLFCDTDVTDEKSVQAAIDKTMDAFGAIHVAINCAGVGTPAK